MKKLNQFFAVSVFAFVLHCGNIFAQQPAQPQPQTPPRPDWQNMDPQQMQQMMQQRMMDNFREQLAVTNDAEWGAIQDRLAKVARMKMEAAMSAGAGMMGGMRRGGAGAGGGPRGFGAFFQQDAETKTLQDAVDNNAPSAQVKTAMARVREARKQKQADLLKAQEELRSLLTTRQEAALILAGMLD